WAADHSRLLQAPAEAKLPTPQDTRRIAERILEQHRLLPELRSDRLRWSGGPAGGTIVSTRTGQGRRDQQIDAQHLTTVSVDVGDRIPGAKALPVVGGGGKFRVTLGQEGKLVAHQGAFRTPVQVEEAELIPQHQADDRFRELTSHANVAEFSSYLAYYCAPAFAEQEFMAPVYVYRGSIKAGDRTVPMRNIIVPGTEFGPEIPTPRTQKARPRASAARIRPLPADLTLTPGMRLPAGLKINRALARERGIDPAKLLVKDPLKPGALIVNPHLPLLTIKELGNLLGFYSAGTSWIGLSGGLAGSQANAQGFVDELAAEGWDIRFNWGDANAWESDWRTNDDQWVDAVDFVFYTGHASMDGWVLSNPDDGFLQFSETGANPAVPGDLWGAKNLEWAVIAACGPLQDSVITPGGGDVFQRWDGAFDGLHLLMGYGAITFDNTEEGRRLAAYARSGMRLVDAWFRTGQEIQPATNGAAAPNGPTVYVSAMYGTKSGANPGSDHLFGHGSVSGDPTGPTGYVAMWSPC
ncbi:MAG: DUF6345 domain-containing protein, partial [Actinomycetota bacterium]